MNLFFLLIYFVIIAAVIEIHVILFRLTGLNPDVSRFQVISMMTGTGFTTGESELVLGHPIRRKLAIFLISFGAFSLAVIISSVSNFLSDDLRAIEILYIAAGVITVLNVLKIRGIQNMLSKLFNRKMDHIIEIEDLPIREVFLTNKQDEILKLHIFKESCLAYNTINQMINEHDQLEIVVLFIQRGELKIKKNIYNTKLQEGDQIFLFGNKKLIREMFKKDIAIMEEKLMNTLA